jgi:hypothetical protein
MVGGKTEKERCNGGRSKTMREEENNKYKIGFPCFLP